MHHALHRHAISPLQLKSARPAVAPAARKEGDAPGEDAQSDASKPRQLSPGSAQPREPLQRTAYRRVRNREEYAQQRLEARKARKAQEAVVREAAQELRSGAADARAAQYKPSVMLVDAYNILFRVPRLKDLFLRDPLSGRGQLEMWVAKYAEAAKIQAVLVYDAMRGPLKENRKERTGPWLSLVYAAESEADTFIVQAAQEYKARKHYKVVCVTGDTGIQMQLADDQYSFIMLDPDIFVQHLQECDRGDTSGPAQWRSSWAVPKLSPARPPATPAGQSRPPQTQGRTQRQAEDEEPVSSDELEEYLTDIVWHALHEQGRIQLEPQLGSALGSDTATLGHGDVGAEPDSDDDDLDFLLKKKRFR